MSVLRVLVEIYDCSANAPVNCLGLPRFGYNRVQFNRYMSGHSFPKPNVLQQICDYFLVDSRIYLEPLTLMIWNGLARPIAARCNRNPAIYIKPLIILNAV